MLLWFAFMTRTVLLTHQCFSYCWAVPAPLHDCLFFPLCTPSPSARGHSQDSWPEGNPKPSDMFSSKSLEKGERGWCLWLWYLSSRVTLVRAEALLSGKCLSSCLADGTQCMNSSIALLVPAVFASPIRLSQSMSLLSFTLLFHPPTELGVGSEWVAVLCASCWSGSTHHSRTLQNLVENSESGILEYFLVSHNMLWSF